MFYQLQKYLFILVSAMLLFVPFLGSIHLFDWDEINFSEAAREMLVTGNYHQVQIDFQPFWEKPPLFIWLQAASMQLFGVGEFAARFPNALFGALSLCTLFYVGRRIATERLAWLWVAFYAMSWLPHLYFKTAIIDPVFNYFIFLAFFQVFLISRGERRMLHAFLAGTFLGLAVLTKGPAAILIALLSLVAFMVWNKGLWGLGVRPLLVIAAACFGVTALWFGLDILRNGWWFTETFINYQIRLFRTRDAGHGGPFFYHFLVLLMGCFPASVFLFGSKNFYRTPGMGHHGVFHFSKWMWILFWVVLILFSIVRTKIVHYSSLCYYPLTFLAALHFSRIERAGKGLLLFYRVAFLILGLIWGIALMALPLLAMHKDKWIHLVQDPFARENLKAAVNWNYAALAIGAVLILATFRFFVVSRKDMKSGLWAFLPAQLAVIFISLWYFAPRVEAYSQRAAVEFYKELQGQEVYVATVGFKSYAHLFYARKGDWNNLRYEEDKMDWLLNGAVDKPVYFVCKVSDLQSLKLLSPFEKLGEKNGFAFFKRALP